MADLNALIRQPTESELAFFKKNSHVGGMATEDDRVILNPYTTLNAVERDAVALNESARVIMRKSGTRPRFELTPEQIKRLKGTPYENNVQAARETIAARILSGDPSAGTPTPDQKLFVDQLAKIMFNNP